ncbi:hypothetical protein [Actinophytocola sp.]
MTALRARLAENCAATKVDHAAGRDAQAAMRTDAAGTGFRDA